MTRAELFRKSARGLNQLAWFIERFGVLVGKSAEVQQLRAKVTELRQMAMDLRELANE
jgi:hypothetical protein